jgi:hypothetical protein
VPPGDELPGEDVPALALVVPGVPVPLDPLEPLPPLDPLVAVPWLDDPADPALAFETAVVFLVDVALTFLVEFLVDFASAPRGRSPPNATAIAASPRLRKLRRVLPLASSMVISEVSFTLSTIIGNPSGPCAQRPHVLSRL